MSVDCIVLSSTHEGCKNQAEVRDPSIAHALPPLPPFHYFPLNTPLSLLLSFPLPLPFLGPLGPPQSDGSPSITTPPFLCERLSASHLGLVGPACDQSLKTWPDLSHLRMATCCIFLGLTPR